MKTIRRAASASFDVEVGITIDNASASFDDPLDRYYPSMSYEEDRSHAG